MSKPALLSGRPIAFSALAVFVFAGALGAQVVDPESHPPRPNAPLNLVLGQPRSLTVNQAYGTVTDALPLIVPPGRRGVEPHLELAYSSGQGNGMLGVGWDLPIGYVQYDSRYGLPQSIASDSFNFSIAGDSGEMANDGGGNYHSTTETVYRVFKKTATGSWTMEDGQGNLYTFGSSAASSIAGTLWLLDSVTDPAGNKITYSYMNDEGALYPETISYTGYGASPGANQLNFTYEQRPDVHTTWTHGVSEIRRLRLKRIEADVLVPTAEMARAYVMTYSLTDVGQSVIGTIQLIGDDNQSSITLRQMTYTNHAEGWNSVQGPTNLGISIPFTQSNGDDTGTRILDINGDGCADLVQNGTTILLGDCTGNFLSNSNSSSFTSSLKSLPVNSTVNSFTDSNGNPQTQSNGLQFIDVNGDGLPDAIIANAAANGNYWGPGNGVPSGVTYNYGVYLNTANQAGGWEDGWTQAANWTMPVAETSYDAQDGLANCSGASTTPFPFSLYYPGTDPNGDEVNGAPSGVSFVDVNGDGLLDIVWSMYQSTGVGNICIAAVYLNTGSGWVKSVALSHQLALWARQSNLFIISNTQSTGWSFFDINGDGMADAVYQGPGSQRALLFTGSGWTQDNNYTQSLQATKLTSTDSQGRPTGLLPYDFSHDGLADLVFSAQGQNPKAFRNTGTGFQEDLIMEAEMDFVAPFQGTIGQNNYAMTAVMADINGDGIMDVIPVNSSGNASFAYLGGWCSLDHCSTVDATGKPDGMMLSDGMISTWKGPLGEEVSVNYTRAPGFFPLPMYVASVLTRSEARADQIAPVKETFSYGYGGGNYTNREFLGFLNTDETQPNGNLIVTWWNQNALFVGRENSKTVYDSNDFTRYTLTNTWTAITPARGYLTEVQETYEDPGPGGPPAIYQTLKTMHYDAHMNLVDLYNNPDTSMTGVDSTTIYTWAINDSAGFWAMPSSVAVFAGNTTSAISMVNNTYYFYDGLSSGEVSAGRLTSQQDTVAIQPQEQVVIRSTTYDQYGNVLTNTDRNGNTSRFVYDALTSTNRVSATDAAGNKICSTFDPRFGAVLADTDPSGNVTSYQYDVFGRLARIIRPGDQTLPGGTVSYTYTLPAPNFPTGLTVTRRDSTSSGISMVSEELYDAYGQVYESLRTNGAEHIVGTTIYDNMGFPIKISKPHFSNQAAIYTALSYDPMHRVAQIQDADGGVTRRSYTGLQMTQTDRRGLVTTTVFNPQRQVVEKTLPTATGTATTQYLYDVLGQLIEVIQADGSRIIAGYDMIGRKIGIVDANTGNFSYQYDNQDHLVAVTGPDGNTIKYTYDKTGNLLSRIYPGASANTLTYGTAGAANAVGRVVSVVDAAGTLKFAYDARGRVTQKTRCVNVNHKTYVTGFAYDSADRLTAMTYPDGFKVNFAYDGLGRVSGVTDGTGRAIAADLTYTASGRLAGLAFGNGVQSSYSYDGLDRLVSQKTAKPGGTQVQNLAYTYDADSNVSTIADTVYSDTQQFTYDSMNRLISATGAGYGTESYTYDVLGNLLTKGHAAFIMDSAHPERADCMIPNTPGVTSCAQAGMQAITMSYDARGNLTTYGNQQYGYDFENRLTAESNNGTQVEGNIYDFWGERVVQQTSIETRIYIDGIYEEGASQASRHVMAGSLLLATIVTPLGVQAAQVHIARHTMSIPLHFLVAAPPAGGSQKPFLEASLGFSLLIMLVGSCFRVSVRGRRLRVRLGAPALFKPFRGAMTLLVVLSMLLSGTLDARALAPPEDPPAPAAGAQRSVTTVTRTTTNAASDTRYYYHVNHLGSVNVITDDNANVVAQRNYKPYGEMYTDFNSASDATLPFTFAGKRVDGAGSLYYFGARFYNPLLGRFLSADTELHQPTNPVELNRYTFAAGNPLRYADPTGHFPWNFVLGGLLILGIVVLASVSGGAGLALLTIVMAGVGCGFGALLAHEMGYSPTSSDFWQIALTGAILGAAIGAGGGAIFDEAMAADAADSGLTLEGADNGVPQTIRSVSTDALKSMAFGSPQSVMVHELQGGGTDGLLMGTIEGTAEAAASGAVMGRLTSAAGPYASAAWRSVSGGGGTTSALTVFGLKLGVTLVIQGGLWTFAGLEHETLPHYVGMQIPFVASIYNKIDGSDSNSQQNPPSAPIVAQPNYDRDVNTPGDGQQSDKPSTSPNM